MRETYGKGSLAIHENKNRIVKIGARQPVRRNILVSKSTKYLHVPSWLSVGRKGKINQQVKAENSTVTKIKIKYTAARETAFFLLIVEKG